MRPPGYEPGELPTAPLRDVFFLSGVKISASRMQRTRSLLRRSLISQGFSRKALQRYYFFPKYQNIYVTFLKKLVFLNISLLFLCGCTPSFLIIIKENIRSSGFILDNRIISLANSFRSSKRLRSSMYPYFIRASTFL